MSKLTAFLRTDLNNDLLINENDSIWHGGRQIAAYMDGAWVLFLTNASFSNYADLLRAYTNIIGVRPTALYYKAEKGDEFINYINPLVKPVEVQY
jgi:hypothetical protein